MPKEEVQKVFVKAMVTKVNKLSRYSLTDKDALAAFVALHNTPEFFRRYLSRYLAYAELGAQAALEDTQAHVFGDANFSEIWKLLPTDRRTRHLTMANPKMEEPTSACSRVLAAKWRVCSVT